MGTPADLKRIADRWRRATRPLKIEDQKYGHELVRMLEARAGQASRVFEDPLEEAVFALLIGMVRTLEDERQGVRDEGTAPARGTEGK